MALNKLAETIVDREEEIANLNRLLERHAGQFIVCGRRRVGKTTLLLHWARTSDLPYAYWVASRNTTTKLIGILKALS